MRNLVKLMLVAGVVALGIGEADGQFVWTKDTRNPILSGGPASKWNHDVATPSVIFNPDSNRFEMWYTGSLIGGIGRAVSTDGISWVKDSDPVLTLTSHSWDSLGAIVPCVIREDSMYRMWYTGVNGPAPGGMGIGATEIGYATSSDGKLWTKHAGNPVLKTGPKPWDAGAVQYCSVIKGVGGYYMFYTGMSSGGLAVICRATSVDGIVWRKDTLNSPVLNAGPAGSWDRNLFLPAVVVNNAKHYMWYTAEAVPGDGHSQIGLATSIDTGKTWTRYGAAPVLPLGTGTWDNVWIELGSVIFRDNVALMWYDGGGPMTSGFGQVGLATAVLTAVEDRNENVPGTFLLAQNYPNPFNPTTTIKFVLPRSSMVRLTVCDMLGRQVAVLVNERKNAGVHEVKLNTSGLSSGVYVYQLQARQIDGGQAGDFVQSKKLVILK